MKVEKKVIVLSILALAIGIATILPLAYIPYSSGAPTLISGVDMILYAHVVPTTSTNNGNILSGDTINIIANFTRNLDATSLNGADAQIEVYNFHVYSDKTSIANITYCIAIDTNIPDSSSKGGFTPAIRGSGDGFWIFRDETKFDVKEVIGYAEGNGQSGFGIGGRVRWSEEEGYYYYIPDPEKDDLFTGRGHYKASCSAFLSEVNGERSAQAQKDLEDAKILYIDVTRVMTVTYKHQTDSSSSTSTITTTIMDSKVIGYIELTKTDWGFASGSIPDFMQNDRYYRDILPPSAFTNPQLPREEYRNHTDIIG